MSNNELSTILVLVGIICIVAAVIFVATLPPEVEPPLEFLSDYTTRIVIAFVIILMGVISIVAGLRF